MVALAATTAPLAFADDLKDKKNKVEKKIDNAHDDLNESSSALRRATVKLRNAQSELAGARKTLARTRGQLTAARIKDRRMQAELKQAEAQLEKAQADLKEGRRNVRKQGAAVGERVAEIYENGDPQLQTLTSLMSAGNPDDVTRTLATSESVLARENNDLDDLKAAEVLLEVNESNLADQRDLVENRRKAAAENLELMQSLEEKAVVETRSVQRLVGVAAQARSGAAKVRARDRKVLQSLQADKKRIEELLRRRAAKGTSKPGASDGFLSYPVQGHVTSPYGYRTHPIYGYYSLHDGTDFGAGCGTPLYASADGTVVESYYSTAYGNRLVVDYGHVRGVGLASIYNHATHYTVGVGAKVKRGELIGYVGTTGWSTGCHLHFTVLENGSTVNPMNWL